MIGKQFVEKQANNLFILLRSVTFWRLNVHLWSSKLAKALHGVILCSKCNVDSGVPRFICIGGGFELEKFHKLR